MCRCVSVSIQFFCTTIMNLWWLNKCNSLLFQKVEISDTQWWSDVSLSCIDCSAGRKQKNRKYHQQTLKWLKYWTQSNISVTVTWCWNFRIHSQKKRYKSCHWGCSFSKGTLLYPKATYWYLSGTY